MKTKTTIFRNSIILFMLLSSVHIFAQTPVFQAPIATPANLDVGTQTSGETDVTIVDRAVLFYNPATSGPTLTLEASLTDNGTPEQTFTSYSWHEVKKSGANEVEGPELGIAQTLVLGTALDGLEPGYHKYRVYGNVAHSDITCQSSYEDMILFVLPPLKPTPAVAGGTAYEYCTSAPPDATTALTFNSSIAYDSAYPLYNSGFSNPDATDFVVSYNWYALKYGNVDEPIDLGTAATSAPAIFSEVGTYTFFVNIEYASTIKDKESRTYVTYNAQVMNGANPVIVLVSPAPGAPTITITNVTD